MITPPSTSSASIMVTTALKVFSETTNYLPPMPALRDFIKMYNLDASKALSQNYLMDMNLSRKIVRKSGNMQDAFVLEVGPGPGSVTRAILEQPCCRLDVVELDKQFMMPLQVLQSHGQGRMHIHQGDILKTDIAKIWEEAGAPKCDWLDEDPPFRVIGNLPFHISSPLVIKTMKEIATRQGAFKFGRVPLTLTFQSEVARRIVAPIDSILRARIGVMCQNWTEPKILFQVPGKCFTPRPKIDVSVVYFKPRMEPIIPASFELTQKLVATLFHHRRRYLEKAVKLLYPKDKAHEMAHDLMRYCRLNPTMHSPDLALENFADMAVFYERQCREHPGLFLFNHREPKPLEELANEHPNPFPPVYKKPSEALHRIDEEGLSLRDFDAAFAVDRLRRRKEKRRENEEEMRKI